MGRSSAPPLRLVQVHCAPAACPAAMRHRPLQAPEPPDRALSPPLPRARRGTGRGAAYAAAINAAIEAHEVGRGAALGALLMEPVLQGAGGMLCVDPAFQRALAQVSLAAGRVSGRVCRCLYKRTRG